MARPNVYNDFYSLSPSEEIRTRHCKGCEYFGVAYHYGLCNYYLETGNRRPCKFGTPCTVKVLRDGYKLPDGYEAWCKAIDEQEAARKEEAERRQREREDAIREWLTESNDMAEREVSALETDRGAERGDSFKYKLPRHINHVKAPGEATEEPSEERRMKRNSKLRWDVDYAFSLYVSGYYVSDIADILGVNRDKLMRYIEQRGWRKFNTCQHYKRADIDYEKRRYAAWVEHKSSSDVDTNGSGRSGGSTGRKQGNKQSKKQGARKKESAQEGAAE